MAEITHLITLDVGVDSPEDWDKVWSELQVKARELSAHAATVAVRSQMFVVEDEMDAKPRLSAALRESGLDEVQIGLALTQIRDYGLEVRKKD